MTESEFEEKKNDTLSIIEHNREKAIKCQAELEQIYPHDKYINNGIYWCDDPNGLPGDLFNVEQRMQGAFLLYLLGMFYMFYALAIVCDDFFVPALEVISDTLELSPDVAGATFMAAGGSAPELFTSIIGVFLVKSNVGIGTIVGSAVFNILFVLGACAFVVGLVIDQKTKKPTVLELTWFPLSRDTFFYVVSLIAVILSFKTGKTVDGSSAIEWWEALYMFSIYFLYVGFMMKNAEAERTIMKTFAPALFAKIVAEEERKKAEKKKLIKNKWVTAGKEVIAIKKRSEQGFSFDVITNLYTAKSVLEDGDDETLPDMCSCTDLVLWNFEEDENNKHRTRNNILRLISMPLVLPMRFTIPDASVKKYEKYYIFSFFMSIVWIIVFSYLMVWWATRLGETWNIDSAIMGLTLLAAGTSVPDLITSVIVAKDGKGDMAVSSSVGSNIFDVTVGLPLPWLIATLMDGPVVVSSDGLGCSIGLLLVMLVTLISSIIFTGWKMNRVMGALMLGLYVVFVVISLLLEYGVFTCPF